MQGNGVITNTLACCGMPGKFAGCDAKVNIAGQTTIPHLGRREHAILRFLKLADALQIPRQGTELEFPVTEFEKSTFKSVIDACRLDAHGYVCVHPGTRNVRRRWPIENFASIANEITAQGFPVILTGSIEEKSLLRELQARINGRVVKIVESFRHLTAGELACVLAHARLLVSNDTGVSHIASALHVPSVILFSPYSHMNRWRPLDTETHLVIPY